MNDLQHATPGQLNALAATEIMEWRVDVNGDYPYSYLPFAYIPSDKWNPSTDRNQLAECQQRIAEMGLIPRYFDALWIIVNQSSPCGPHFKCEIIALLFASPADHLRAMIAAVRAARAAKG